MERNRFQLDLRRYDGAGRLLQSGTPDSLPAGYALALNEGVPAADVIGLEQLISRYDANGQLLVQGVFSSDGDYRYGTNYTREASAGNGYDAAGNLLGYEVYQRGAPPETHRLSLAAQDGYVLTAHRVNSGTNAAQTSTSSFDANGHLNQITDSGQSANDRRIYSDAAGRASGSSLASCPRRLLVALVLRVDEPDRPLGRRRRRGPQVGHGVGQLRDVALMHRDLALRGPRDQVFRLAPSQSAASHAVDDQQTW